MKTHFLISTKKYIIVYSKGDNINSKSKGDNANVLYL